MRFPFLIVALLSNITTALAERHGRVASAAAAVDEDSLLTLSQIPRRKLKKSSKQYVERRHKEPSSKDDSREEMEKHSSSPAPAPSRHPTSSSSSGDDGRESPSVDEPESPKSSPPGSSASMPTNPEIKKRKRNYSDKQMSKLSKKSRKSSKGGKGKGSSSSSKSTKSKGKGKDKSKDKSKGSSKKMGMGPSPSPNCMSSVAETLKNVVPDVITKNPSRCCDFEGPIGVYVTHAEPNNSTSSGFEPFWDTVYGQIARTSALNDVCFVMTGYDSTSERSLSDIITDATVLASSLPETTAMMVTDPTSDLVLMNEIRFIVNDLTLPSIGVFNSGYNNILIESLVSGQDRIPYIGFMDDADFGTEAARFTMDLLDGVPAVPLCFNGRPDLEFVGERCATYYTELSDQLIEPTSGVKCSIESSVEEIFGVLVESGANAVYSHVDCCSVVAAAVQMARSMGQSILAVGCQDEDTSGGEVDFVTTQPILLQAYSPASWVNLPVRQALQGNDGRGEMFFPAVSSLLITAIYTIPIM